MKYLVAILLAISAALSGYTLWMRTEAEKAHNTIQQYERTIKEYEASKARVDAARAVLAQELQTLKVKQKEAYRAKELAIEGDKEWADTAVPHGIADWVRNSTYAVP